MEGRHGDGNKGYCTENADAQYDPIEGVHTQPWATLAWMEEGMRDDKPVS